MSSFGADTAVERLQPGSYRGTLASGWDIGGNANGGYLMALAANGLRQVADRPDPVSVTAHYLSPGRPGDALVTGEVIKARSPWTCAW